jgi:hypothetical protein
MIQCQKILLFPHDQPIRRKHPQQQSLLSRERYRRGHVSSACAWTMKAGCCQPPPSVKLHQALIFVGASPGRAWPKHVLIEQRARLQ